MSSNPFPILFLAPSDPIDAVLASGLLKRLHDEIPEGRFTIVADTDVAALFRDMPHLDEIVVHARASLRDVMRLWMRLRPRQWGLALDAGGGRLIDWLSVRQRATARSVAAGGVHRVVEAARLLRLEDEPPPPFLFLSDETRLRASELLGEGGPILAMIPATPWGGSTWPVERFSRAAVQLLGEDGPMRGGRVLIVGAPADWKAAESLRRSLPRDRWIDLTPETDPLVIYACLSQARLCIGGAVIWTHLAAAAGAPTLGLYGPSDETVNGVWGERARVVRGPRSFEAIQQGDPDLDKPVCHMLDLTVESVIEAAIGLLEQTQPAKQEKSDA